MITFRICKPRANARGGGTAFPICLCLSQTLPSNTKLWSLDSPRPACLDLGASPVLAGPIVLDQWLLFWKAPPWPTNKSLPLLVISVTWIYLFSRYWTAAYSTRSIWYWWWSLLVVSPLLSGATMLGRSLRSLPSNIEMCCGLDVREVQSLSLVIHCQKEDNTAFER